MRKGTEEDTKDGREEARGNGSRVSALPGGRFIQGVAQGAPDIPAAPTTRLRVDGMLGFLLL